MKIRGKRQFEIRESRRRPFYASVEIRWTDTEGHSHSTGGTTVDVSVYGLGVLIPRQLPADQELTVILNGVEVCGGAVVRHSERSEAGFNVGLYFRLALLMQKIPEIDALLEPSLSVQSSRAGQVIAALASRYSLRFWRWITARATRSVTQLRSGFGTARVKATAEEDGIS
jgi:hypothetical protein